MLDRVVDRDATAGRLDRGTAVAANMVRARIPPEYWKDHVMMWSASLELRSATIGAELRTWRARGETLATTTGFGSTKTKLMHYGHQHRVRRPSQLLANGWTNGQTQTTARAEVSACVGRAARVPCRTSNDQNRDQSPAAVISDASRSSVLGSVAYAQRLGSGPAFRRLNIWERPKIFPFFQALLRSNDPNILRFAVTRKDDTNAN
jgi:hypothetical protein